MDDGFIASTHPEWIQGSFKSLMGVFGWVGLSMKMGKTFGMIFHPCCAVEKHSDASYGIQMAVEGLTFQAYQKNHARFPDYAEDLATGYLTAHRQTQHKFSHGTQW